jgi:putative ABC transport system ATP-binding protein
MSGRAADLGLAIRARNLRFSYRERGREGAASFALRLPAWDVPRGASAVLHGPSGCGKSTLLNLISGVLRPEQGSLEVEGLDLATASEARRRAHRIRSVGIVFQDFPLVDYLDATENVLFPYRLNPALRLDSAARERARALLDQLGLGSRLNRRPATLSQGERQRVAIARAIVTEPRLLLADEPTGGLDPGRSESVMDLLDGLRRERGLTLLAVSHDPALIPRFELTLEVDQLRVEPAP